MNFLLVAQARRSEAALWPRRQASPPVDDAGNYVEKDI